MKMRRPDTRAGRTARKILRRSRRVVSRGLAFAKDGKYRQIADGYDLKGYKRFYLVHIRKTGGTSLNNMFLSLSGEDPSRLYAQLSRAPDNRLLSNGKIYVGWNVKYINKGFYYYAFSHTPFYRLSLPQDTFTLCCFRDPAQRVISHYRMLMDFRLNGVDHPCMEIEGKWLGNDFDDFLSRIPKEHLLNQLYMFSPRFDVGEAVRNARKLSYFFFSEDFESGVAGLNKRTDLNLRPVHIRKANFQAEASAASLARLAEMLTDEYRFLNTIGESRYSRQDA